MLVGDHGADFDTRVEGQSPSDDHTLRIRLSEP